MPVVGSLLASGAFGLALAVPPEPLNVPIAVESGA